MATGTTNVGFEEQLWQAADKLRSNMDAAEYKHVVLGLIFLKYVSDSFTEKYNALKAEGYGDEEDRDEYLADNIFWVPKEARWESIKAHATNPDIGKVIDAAMEAIEDNFWVMSNSGELFYDFITNDAVPSSQACFSSRSRMKILPRSFGSLA